LNDINVIPPEVRMLGTVDHQAELLDADQLCGHLVPEDSIHRKLAVLGDKLFSDRDFADLYDRARGRHSVPPSMLAKVMLLQSLEGTSDRETVDRVRRDIGSSIAHRTLRTACRGQRCSIFDTMSPTLTSAWGDASTTWRRRRCGAPSHEMSMTSSATE